MNIFNTIKNIFSKTQPVTSNPVATHGVDAYIVKHTKEIEEEAKKFIVRYGNDFDKFFYRPNFDTFIRSEILPFKEPEAKYNNFFDNSYWKAKHPFNFPGPFYTGESDTCGTGDVEAPNNVM